MSPLPGNIQLSPKAFEELIQRLAQQRLEPNEYELLIQVVQAMGWMSQELEDKKLSIRRLQRLFGIKTEISKHLLEEDDDPEDPCPECLKGRLYELSNPGIVIRVKGQSPIQATIYELQKYRCNLCGQVFVQNYRKALEIKYTMNPLPHYLR